jgi:hypothetical protein
MNRQKLILIGVIVVLFFGMVATITIQNGILKKERAEKLRWQVNYNEIAVDRDNYISLNLTIKEALKARDLKIDSISTLLRIKPKTIERIIYKEIIQHDTIREEIPVQIITQNSWRFTDVGDCYVYKGEVFYTGDTIHVERVGFTYQNEVIDTFFKFRKHWIFSKWQYLQKSVSTCGESKTRDIKILKK